MIFLNSGGFAEEPLVLGTFVGPPLSNAGRTGFYDLVLIEAFGRIDRRIEIVSLPAERSLLNADSGITDGDFVRVAGLEGLYPNLIRVPEKIVDFEFVAFARDLDPPPVSWNALKSYDVAIVRGWKILEENVVEFNSLVRTADQRQLFNLLGNDRVDIVIYSRFEGYALIRALGIKDARPLEPPLAIREMYLYLNDKHRDLVSPLAEALRAMKADNTYRTLRKRALGPYLNE
ncbi:MAG: transporter substrate-binding domain-containing protein [Desulfurivibrionaceae bacterium]|nr:transporter substrate-binding domain-containing protein [Desulfurivibrionaceae bacterium]